MSSSKAIRFLVFLIPHLAALATLALALRLAVWQLDRAEEKAEVMQAWSQDSAIAWTGQSLAALPPFTRLEARGRFDQDRHILLDNQTRNNHPGVHVFSLLELEPHGQRVLVNRGWQPWQRHDSDWPEFDTPSGIQDIQGRVTTAPQPGLKLGEAEALNPADWPNLMTYLELERVAEVFGPTLSDRILLLDPAHPLHLTGEPWPRVNMGPEKHRAYAFQWAAIAFAIVVLWLGLSVRALIRRNRS